MKTGAIAIAFLFFFLLSACTTVNPEPIGNSQLGPKKFVLEADTVFEDVLAGKNKAEMVLSKGEYRLAYADASGHYYLGGEGCLQELNFAGDGLANRRNGGLWIPSADKSPRLFTFVGQPTQEDMKMGAAVFYMTKLEAGRIKKIPGPIRESALSAIHFVD